jgi:tryptophan-rich hypothetical protein
MLMKPIKRIVNPKKLLNSKWTAVFPRNKEKHFIVIKLISPPTIDEIITSVEIEAIHSKRTEIIPWQQLSDANVWRQGWV